MPSDTTLAADPAPVSMTHPYQDDVAFQAWRQLFLTSVKLQRRCESMLAPFDLVMSQFEALFKVGLNPGQSQQDLCSALLLTKGNIGALVDRLEGMGMIQRRADEKDRRVNRLYLTPEGRRRVTEIFARHRELVHEMMEPLSHPQLAQLRSLLQLLEPPTPSCTNK
jgi:DNA-binding MarR family transcriptional regulator